MMGVWLKRIGTEIARRRAGETQEAFARRVGISRQQLSIIENGKRSYSIEPLLAILTGIGTDPVQSLLDMTAHLNALDTKTIDAVRTVVECLSDGRRVFVAPVIQSWQLSRPLKPSTDIETSGDS